MSYRLLILSSVCFIWLGMVLAISFLEAPVKFLAPSLTRAVALDVGRTVFTAFHMVQGGLAVIVLLLGLSVIKSMNIWHIVLLVILGSLLLLQSFWLLPVLNQRALDIGTGLVLEPSYHHLIYVVLEALKAILLATLAVAFLQRANNLLQVSA